MEEPSDQETAVEGKRRQKRWLNDDIKIETHRGVTTSKPQPSSQQHLNNSKVQGTHQKFHYEMAKSMVPELYISATTGNIDAFERAIKDRESSPLDQVSPRGNTVLHLAASSGHNQLVELIVQRPPGLVNCLNNKGEHALHLAASCGHLPTVKSLIPDNNVLKIVNNEGKTALCVALENHHQVVAEFLAEKDPTAPHYQKHWGKNSPLYMAADAGYRELVKLTKDKEPDGSNINQKEELKGNPNVRFYDKRYEGKTLLHAAILGRNRDVLNMIWGSDPSLTDSTFDKEGRTPLSFAAYIGYLEGVQYLLDKSTGSVYQSDLTGAFPIHMAASRGHIEIVQEFLKRCPDSRELLNREGRNILHVAAMFGKAKAVSYMLKTSELEMLINERDNNGDTPLHLATQQWHPKVVTILTWDKRVRLEIENKDGLTARDLAEEKLETTDQYGKLLTLIALQSANAPPSEHLSTMRTKPESYSSLEPPNKEHYRERVNTLLLVSTLVATVTFAAGITLPGGNNDSDPDKGMAKLITKPTFQAFFICNTIAMYSSIIVVITLIFAQVADLNLILTALNLALPLLGVAVTMMSLAFIVGTYLVVSNLNWLAIVVLIMGLIFLVNLFALFIPLYSPFSSNHYIVRYVFYYPFCLMIWASGSDIDRKKD